MVSFVYVYPADPNRRHTHMSVSAHTRVPGKQGRCQAQAPLHVLAARKLVWSTPGAVSGKAYIGQACNSQPLPPNITPRSDNTTLGRSHNNHNTHHPMCPACKLGDLSGMPCAEGNGPDQHTHLCWV
jgi:hypothetical protein